MAICSKDEGHCSKDEVEQMELEWKDAIHGFFADKKSFLPSTISAMKNSQF